MVISRSTIAVAIKIAVSQSAADLGLRETAADFARPRRETSLALVQEQMRRLRVADVAANVAHRVVNVAVGDHQIEPAVEIEVGRNTQPNPNVVRGGRRRPLRVATSS